MERSRTLRRNMTDAERKLWYEVRDKRLSGYKIKRQYPVPPYILDFACFEAMLAIEVDGGQHAENFADESRTAWLNERGWSVMRFWNNELLQNIDGVTHTILRCLGQRMQSPSPSHPCGMGPSLSHGERGLVP